VAEGGGLLNRYRVKSSIGGSNPPLSARIKDLSWISSFLPTLNSGNSAHHQRTTFAKRMFQLLHQKTSAYYLRSVRRYNRQLSDLYPFRKRMSVGVKSQRSAKEETWQTTCESPSKKRIERQLQAKPYWSVLTRTKPSAGCST
jgi:hypothetical protein